MFKLLVFLFTTFVSLHIFAGSEERPSFDSPDKIKEAIAKIQSVVPLPIDGMSAVQDKNGDIFYISKNGRYAFRGTMIDAWTLTPIDSMEKLANSINTIQLEKMGINVDGFNPVVIGDGDQVVTIFTDPTCEPCLLLNKELESLSSEFTFKILHVPVLGDQSKKITESLFCADPSLAKEAVEKQNYKLVSSKKECDKASYQKRLLAADILQVRQVPFIISPDHRVSRGKPKSLAVWLKSSS